MMKPSRGSRVAITRTGPRRLPLMVECALLATIAIALAGCEGASPTDLEDVRWSMTAHAAGGEMVDALDDVSVTATFDGSTVSGSGGCNSYSASYVAEGTSIEIGPAAATLVACPEPIMAQEQDFFAALAEVAAYEVSETELTLLDEDGDERLRFEASEPVSLEGTDWIATGINNGREAVVSVTLGSQVTAVFGEAGEVSGSAGCNSYSGPFEADGDSISIGPLAATEMFCEEPEGVMEQEQAFLAAMQSATVYELSEDRLTLRDSGGATQVTFEAE